MPRPDHQIVRHASRVCLIAVLAAGAVASAGCYRRVVGAKGLGAGSTPVHEPSPPSLWDQMFGSEPEPEPQRNRVRVN